MSLDISITRKYVLGNKTLVSPAETTNWATSGTGLVSNVFQTSDTPAVIDTGDIATLKQCFFHNLSSTADEWIDIYDDVTKICRVDVAQQCLVDLEHVAPADLKVVANTAKTPLLDYTLYEK